MLNKRSYFSLVLTAVLLLSLVLPANVQAQLPSLIRWCQGATQTTCTDYFDTFTGGSGLIAELANGTGVDTGAGTIYIDSDYDGTGEDGDIIFDYDDLDNLTNLTIQ